MSSAPGETPPERVAGIPDELVRRLAHLWIASAEQLAATGATPRGLASLAEQLDVGVDEVAGVVGGCGCAPGGARCWSTR